MSHKKLRPFIVKVSVLGYFPLLANDDYFTSLYHLPMINIRILSGYSKPNK